MPVAQVRPRLKLPNGKIAVMVSSSPSDWRSELNWISQIRNSSLDRQFLILDPPRSAQAAFGCLFISLEVAERALGLAHPCGGDALRTWSRRKVGKERIRPTE